MKLGLFPLLFCIRSINFLEALISRDLFNERHWFNSRTDNYLGTFFIFWFYYSWYSPRFLYFSSKSYNNLFSFHKVTFHCLVVLEMIFSFLSSVNKFSYFFLYSIYSKFVWMLSNLNVSFSDFPKVMKLLSFRETISF